MVLPAPAALVDRLTMLPWLAGGWYVRRCLGVAPWPSASWRGHADAGSESAGTTRGRSPSIRCALRSTIGRRGHSAEMSFFALLTLVPSTVAVGAALSFLERFVGPQRIARGQDEAVAALRVLMSPRLTDEVIAPFVRAQLSQQRGGVALGGLVLTWWLSSHLFTSTSHALDRAYGVTDRRPTLTRRFIALGFALASVVVVALTLGILVVGPLGGGPDIAERLGLGRAIALTWILARWPALLLVLIGFLVCLHRFSPNVEHSWKDCVPGAALGVVLWVVAAAGFRLYLGLGVEWLAASPCRTRRSPSSDGRSGPWSRPCSGPISRAWPS